MNFLHNETTGTVERLTQVGEKSSYQAHGSINGHLKAYSLEDTTFSVSGVSGVLYKLTAKSTLDIKEADRVTINGTIYKVKDVKNYSGLSFNTIKVLLSTEN